MLNSSMIKSLEELNVYRLSMDLAMEIFFICEKFPIHEKYSLVSQLTRAARSIPLNIAEGWGRRVYSNEFKKSLIYSMGSVEETKAALELAFKYNYLTEEKFQKLIISYKMVAAQLHNLSKNW